jgi:superfamily II DNA helicase RecQ
MGVHRLERHGGVILDLIALNPEETGDSELLAAQKEEAASHQGEKKEAHAVQRTVSPQAERRIYMKMQELRQKIAVRERSKPYLVAGNTLLKHISQTAPHSEDELFHIVGFRSSGLRDEVETILQIVAEQMEET